MDSGMKLKVKPDRLESVSEQVNIAINKVEKSFQQIENIVERSSRYWEGEGRTAYVSSYRKKKNTVNIAIRRLRENVTDLQRIAGIYKEGERKAFQVAESLPKDVII